jgi:2-polyprenyl-6-methoxyphenol hydroxylase-like FAD-dependent oxidoreductase
MVFGKHAFFGYTVSPTGEIWWFANPPCGRELSEQELAAIPTAEWQRRLIDLFAADAAPTEAIITATHGALTASKTYELPTVPTWRRGRMIILGDAAHAAAPSSGQGASLAMEDAVVLAKCLRDLPDVEQAFAVYEHLRRHRVERVVAHGARSSSGKAVGPITRVLRDLLLPLLLKRFASAEAQAWIFSYQVDWDTPIEHARQAA